MSGIVQVVGIPGILSAMKVKQKSIERALARGITKGALLIQKTARRKIMDGPKTGLAYKRGKKEHIASAPGEAPANDTGNLQRSIVVVAASPSDRVTALVNANAEYANWLENGTLDGKIQPRPFLTPSAEENAKKIGDMVKEEIEKAINS